MSLVKDADACARKKRAAFALLGAAIAPVGAMTSLMGAA
jgi:hypothetical protein